MGRKMAIRKIKEEKAMGLDWIPRKILRFRRRTGRVGKKDWR